MNRHQWTRRAFLKTSAAGAVAAVLPGSAAGATVPATRPAPRAALVYHEDFLKHLADTPHPESPERLTAIIRKLNEGDFIKRLVRLTPKPAPVEVVQLVHEKAYVDLVRREVAEGRRSLSTGDTAIDRTSYDVALLAVGAVTAAVDAVMAGDVKRAFCALRPPGHHSRPAKGGMGFCIFNNAAIAARYAQKRRQARRVLIVDFDVHHGNGTQDTFYEDPSVVVFDTHQWPLYPMTGMAEERGKGPGEGTQINCPFPPGAGDQELLAAFSEKLVPAAEKFKPDLVVISAGFDSRVGDPIGGFTVTDTGFARLTRIVCDLAEKHAKGRVVSVLEGGYNLAGLASAVRAHVEALL